jgi:enamine deaminase RidA (YjgF/YER057c/UK114 family)
MTLKQHHALEPDDFPYFNYRRMTFSLAIAAGGSIWLSGNTAARYDAAKGGMVVEGDVVAQASLIHGKMQAALGAANKSLSDIYRIVRYVTPAALPDLARLDLAQAKVFDPAMSVATVVVHSLLRKEALIEIEGVATGSGGEKLTCLPSVFATSASEAAAAVGETLAARSIAERAVLRRMEYATPSTHGMRASAQTLQILMPRVMRADASIQVDLTAASADPSRVRIVCLQGDPRAGDIVGQCRDIYMRLKTELAAMGADLSAIVKTTEFIVPAALAGYRETGAVRRELFAPPYPAATGVLCAALPDKGAVIALEATAVLEAP